MCRNFDCPGDLMTPRYYQEDEDDDDFVTSYAAVKATRKNKRNRDRLEAWRSKG